MSANLRFYLSPAHERCSWRQAVCCVMIVVYLLIAVIVSRPVRLRSLKVPCLTILLPAALNITSTRQRLPAAVSHSGSSEVEPRTTVTHPGLIERAAVVVPKLKADSTAGDAGESIQSLRPSAASLVHGPARPHSCPGLGRIGKHVCSARALCCTRDRRSIPRHTFI